LLDPVSIQKALDGVDKLYLLNGVIPDELTQGLNHFASKLAIESALHQFDIPFTILRPSYFFRNDTSLKAFSLSWESCSFSRTL
jgi:uncharacterized protein YbjT (DUF2867 family)